jgi:hypothetical protein
MKRTAMFTKHIRLLATGRAAWNARARLPVSAMLWASAVAHGAAPSWDWPVASPESQGMSSARLAMIPGRQEDKGLPGCAQRPHCLRVVCGGIHGEDETGKRLDQPRDPFTLARDEAPMLFAPGEKLQYSNPGIGMMTYCVSAAIRGGEHQDIRTLLLERVMRPIGVPDADWSAGYGKTFTVDGLPLVGTWGGGAYTPRATARIGRLVLRGGNWEGRQILSQDSVRQATGDAGLPGNCGMGWWGNGGRRYSKLPPDAVWGAGAGDQLLLVVPSLKLIMVRNGETLAPALG